MINENRLGDVHPGLGRARAGAHHRYVHHRHEPDGRRHRPASHQEGTTDERTSPGADHDRAPTQRHRGRGPAHRAHCARRVDVVDDIDLVLGPGEVVGLVGESGSGKTTVGTALLGYARAGAPSSSGKVLFDDKDVLGLPWQQVRQLRGEEIAYVPQDPASALNPTIRIGKQIVELMELRGIGTAESRLQGARDGLDEVGLPNDDEFLRRYSHQLSGGQVQRVALAMAFLPKPKVLVLDEPTTGLDVTTQGMVLQTMGELCRAHGVAALYVTHDLAVVANIADRVAVMYAGQIVELGHARDALRPPGAPLHAGAARLDPAPEPGARAAAASRAARPLPGARPAGCRFHDRCEYAIDECTRRPCPSCARSRRTTRCAASASRRSARWDISRGIVPDTDPDKPRDIILEHRGPRRLLRPQEGRARREPSTSARPRSSRWWASPAAARPRSRAASAACTRSGPARSRSRATSWPRARGSAAPSDRKRIQYIFQNPYLSLNPRLTIEQIVKRPMELFGIASGKAATERVVDLLEQVALGPAVLKYQASRLSGGERQRVAIARALAAEPDLLVCDEITSALDVSVQGSIVSLLEELRSPRGISMLFVTHNLALVRSIAARVQILHAGRVVESGSGRPGHGHPAGGLHQAAARQHPPHRLMAPSAMEPSASRSRRCSSSTRSRRRCLDARRGPCRAAAPLPRAAAPPRRAQIAGAGRMWTLPRVADARPTAPRSRGRRSGRQGASCTSGTPTGSAPTTLFLGASMTKSVLAAPGRAARRAGALDLDDRGRRPRARARGQRLRRLHRRARADHDHRGRLGRGPPRPAGPATRLLACFAGDGGDSRALLAEVGRRHPPGHALRVQHRRLAGARLGARARHRDAVRRGAGRLWATLGCEGDAFVALDAPRAWRWPAAAWPLRARTGRGWRCCSSTARVRRTRARPRLGRRSLAPRAPFLAPGRLPSSITTHAGFG